MMRTRSVPASSLRGVPENASMAGSKVSQCGNADPSSSRAARVRRSSRSLSENIAAGSVTRSSSPSKACTSWAGSTSTGARLASSTTISNSSETLAPYASMAVTRSWNVPASAPPGAAITCIPWREIHDGASDNSNVRWSPGSPSAKCSSSKIVSVCPSSRTWSGRGAESCGASLTTAPTRASSVAASHEVPSSNVTASMRALPSEYQSSNAMRSSGEARRWTIRSAPSRRASTSLARPATHSVSTSSADACSRMLSRPVP